MTEKLGAIAAEQAGKLDKKIAIVGVGGLSGSYFRHAIDISQDRIASEAEDLWNQKILALMAQGDLVELLAQCPAYATEARVDMGFKHFAFILGAMGGKFSRSVVHGYAPLYGAGGAVVEFQA